MVNPVPTETMIPTATVTPIPPTPTNTPTSTLIPTKTPTPIIFVTLHSPFAADCGDGIPQIWVNESPNGVVQDTKYGHVDIWVPVGCAIDNYDNEFVAPISGTVSKQGENVYDINFPKGVFPEGIFDVLRFVGIENPSLDLIHNLRLNFGHVNFENIQPVTAGEPVADIVWSAPKNNHSKVGYQVIFSYNGKQYHVSPTLFPTLLPDGTILRAMLNGTRENWKCYPSSPYNCVPIANFPAK